MALIRSWVVFGLLICLVCCCHYSCTTACTSDKYYECTTCDSNRGDGGSPVYGMCYCSEGADEDENGICQSEGKFN